MRYLWRDYKSPGYTLYARREAYQRTVSAPDFSAGIAVARCVAGDGVVWRARDDLHAYRSQAPTIALLNQHAAPVYMNANNKYCLEEPDREQR